MRTSIRAALVGSAVLPLAAMAPGLAFAGEAAPVTDKPSHSETGEDHGKEHGKEHGAKDGHHKKDGHRADDRHGEEKGGEWTRQEAESSNGLPDLAGLPIGPADLLALLNAPAAPQVPVQDAPTEVTAADEPPAAETADAEEPTEEPAGGSALPELPIGNPLDALPLG